MNCLASVWCCIENILLSLADDDVYGVTFIPQNTEGVKKVLNIPEKLEIAAIIPNSKIPTIETPVNFSLNITTPKIAAVSGSTSVNLEFFVGSAKISIFNGFRKTT